MLVRSDKLWDYAIGTLKAYGPEKQEWFMGNVATWILYDSDDSDSPDDFATEDLTAHYARNMEIL